jgi:hypothetical protein
MSKDVQNCLTPKVLLGDHDAALLPKTPNMREVIPRMEVLFLPTYCLPKMWDSVVLRDMAWSDGSKHDTSVKRREAFVERNLK